MTSIPGNLKAEVTAEWAGGEHLFRLTVPMVLELEQKCAAPFGTVFGRVQSGAFTIDDLMHTVRLGLIGGGTKPQDVAALMRSYAYPERPLSELMVLARVILQASMFGFEVAPINRGKSQAAGSRKRSMPRPSTAPPPLSN